MDSLLGADFDSFPPEQSAVEWPDLKVIEDLLRHAKPHLSPYEIAFWKKKGHLPRGDNDQRAGAE